MHVPMFSGHHLMPQTPDIGGKTWSSNVLDTPKKRFPFGIGASIRIGQESRVRDLKKKCCSYILYAYNDASVSANQIQSHETFLFHKLSRKAFLCVSLYLKGD